MRVRLDKGFFCLWLLAAVAFFRNGFGERPRYGFVG